MYHWLIHIGQWRKHVGRTEVPWKPLFVLPEERHKLPQRSFIPPTRNLIWNLLFLSIMLYIAPPLSPFHSHSLYLFAVPILHYLPVLISIDMAEEASSLHLIHQQLLFDFESFESFVSNVNDPSQTSTSDSSPSTSDIIPLSDYSNLHEDEPFSPPLFYFGSIRVLPVWNQIPQIFHIKSSATSTQHLGPSAHRFSVAGGVRFRRYQAL